MLSVPKSTVLGVSSSPTNGCLSLNFSWWWKLLLIIFRRCSNSRARKRTTPVLLDISLQPPHIRNLTVKSRLKLTVNMFDNHLPYEGFLTTLLMSNKHIPVAPGLYACEMEPLKHEKMSLNVLCVLCIFMLTESIHGLPIYDALSFLVPDFVHAVAVALNPTRNEMILKTWCGIAWQSIVWCSVVWCDIVWYSVLWCGME